MSEKLFPPPWPRSLENVESIGKAVLRPFFQLGDFLNADDQQFSISAVVPTTNNRLTVLDGQRFTLWSPDLGIQTRFLELHLP